MSLPDIEVQEIKNIIRRFIDEFRDIHGSDNREYKLKEVLEYLVTKPMFITSYPRFKNAVLSNIRHNSRVRGNVTPIINYDYYYNIFQAL